MNILFCNVTVKTKLSPPYSAALFCDNERTKSQIQKNLSLQSLHTSRVLGSCLCKLAPGQHSHSHDIAHMIYNVQSLTILLQIRRREPKIESHN